MAGYGGVQPNNFSLYTQNAKVARELLEKDENMKDMCRPVDRVKTSDIRPEAPLPGEEIEPPPRYVPKGGQRMPEETEQSLFENSRPTPSGEPHEIPEEGKDS